MTRSDTGDDGHTYEMVTIGNTQLCLMDDSLYLLYDDVILAPWQVELLRQEALGQNEASKTRASVSTKFTEYWPNGIVYYTVASNFLQPNRVTQAIANYENNTAVRFVPRTNQRNYVEFVNVAGGTSWSNIGMIGGKQTIQIGDPTLGATTASVIHEIGHTVGLHHEHNRNDRDDYVQIHWGNITSGNAQWFEIKNNNVFDVGAFDFNSVMIYHSWSFAKPNTTTITRLDGSTFSMGSTLSSGDIYALRIMYEPDPTPMYVKLVSEYIPEESSYHWGGMGDYWYSVYDNWLEFYSDLALTNRIHTPEAIKQVGIHYTLIRDGEMGTIVKNFFIHPGTWKVSLSRSVDHGESPSGYVSYFYLEEWSNPTVIR